MIEIKCNGKPFSAETFEEQFMLAAAEQIRAKLGSIRHPVTGEFPTIAISGNSLSNFSIQLEGSPELVALAQSRLKGEDDIDHPSAVAVDSDSTAGVRNRRRFSSALLSMTMHWLNVSPMHSMTKGLTRGGLAGVSHRVIAFGKKSMRAWANARTSSFC